MSAVYTTICPAGHRPGVQLVVWITWDPTPSVSHRAKRCGVGDEPLCDAPHSLELLGIAVEEAFLLRPAQ